MTIATGVILAVTRNWAVWGVLFVFEILALGLSMSNLNPKNRPECPACNGSGEVWETRQLDDGWFGGNLTMCPLCGGTGR